MENNFILNQALDWLVHTNFWYWVINSMGSVITLVTILAVLVALKETYMLGWGHAKAERTAEQKQMLPHLDHIHHLMGFLMRATMLLGLLVCIQHKPISLNYATALVFYGTWCFWAVYDFLIDFIFAGSMSRIWKNLVHPGKLILFILSVLMLIF